MTLHKRASHLLTPFLCKGCLLMVLLMSRHLHAQELYIDAIDTSTDSHFHITSGKDYMIRLLTDTQTVLRKIHEIRDADLILSGYDEGYQQVDTVPFCYLDTIGFIDSKAHLKSYALGAGFGSVLIIGAFYSLDLATTKGKLLAYGSIPVGLLAIPLLTARYFTDLMYPVDYINTGNKYAWYVLKKEAGSEKLHD